MEDKEIHEICEKYNITNYKINNGLVDVDGGVNLCYKGGLTELPLNFGHIKGDFDCSCNKLTTLKGCPKIINGGFYCGVNKLNSLEYAPDIVNGMVSVYDNPLIDLKYLPSGFTSLIASNTAIKNLIGLPNILNGNLDLSCCSLKTLEGCPEKILGDFELFNNKKLSSLEHCAKYVGSDFIISHCSLTSLKGSPEYVGGNFDVSHNKLTDLNGISSDIGNKLRLSGNNLYTLDGLQYCWLVGDLVIDIDSPIHYYWQKLHLNNYSIADFDRISGLVHKKNDQWYFDIDGYSEWLRELNIDTTFKLTGYYKKYE